MPTQGYCEGTNYFSQYFSGNLFACLQKPSLVQQEQMQIQSVADNVKKYYGADSVSAAVAQQAADAQKTYAVSDVNDITNKNLSDCKGVDLTFVGIGCIEWYKFYLVGGAIALLFLLPYILPFILRPRR